jgi:flagellar hook-associated protein 3 FlgL
LIEGRLQNLQTQIATGSRIPQSSEQPMDAVTLSARRELEGNISQFQKNLGKVTDRLSLVDATVEEAVNVATRVKELFLSSNTATVSQSERLSVRQEILRIKETMISLSNTTDSSGDALFGGFSTEAMPFREQLNGSVEYFGDGGVHKLSVSETIKLPTSLNGANVFMEIDVEGKKQKCF